MEVSIKTSKSKQTNTTYKELTKKDIVVKKLGSDLTPIVSNSNLGSMNLLYIFDTAFNEHCAATVQQRSVQWYVVSRSEKPGIVLFFDLLCSQFQS